MLFSGVALLFPVGADGSGFGTADGEESDEAIADIFDIASGSDKTLFSFSPKSASKINTPFSKHLHYFLAFFLACRVDELSRLLGRDF